MQIPRIDPWRTVGTVERLDAIERAVKLARKGGTTEERVVALGLIRKLVDGIEHHLTGFTANGFPKRPPGA